GRGTTLHRCIDTHIVQDTFASGADAASTACYLGERVRARLRQCHPWWPCACALRLGCGQPRRHAPHVPKRPPLGGPVPVCHFCHCIATIVHSGVHSTARFRHRS